MLRILSAVLFIWLFFAVANTQYASAEGFFDSALPHSPFYTLEFFTPAFAQNEYNEINWFEVIGYMLSNPWLTLELLADQGNVDRIYEKFVEYHNNWVFNSIMPSTIQMETLANNADKLKASREFCTDFTADDIEILIKAIIPYDELVLQCNIPAELNGIIRDKLS